MSITTMFRSVLAASLIFSVFSFLASISLAETLPTALQDYLTEVENEDISVSRALFYLAAMLALLILLPVSIIGLWKFKSWARTLYVVITIAFIPFYPAIGPVVMNGWEAMFYDIAILFDGVLLAMMFTGEISQKFSPSSSTANS